MQAQGDIYACIKVPGNFIFLPELVLERIESESRSSAKYHLRKESDFEVCPKCATPSESVYDRRTVTIKDEPIRGKQVILVTKKRRFWCSSCYKPFTEPVKGIPKRHHSTERFKRAIFNACMKYNDLSVVERVMRCGTGTVYRSMRSQLEKKHKQHQYPARPFWELTSTLCGNRSIKRLNTLPS